MHRFLLFVSSLVLSCLVLYSVPSFYESKSSYLKDYQHIDRVTTRALAMVALPQFLYFMVVNLLKVGDRNHRDGALFASFASLSIYFYNLLNKVKIFDSIRIKTIFHNSDHFLFNSVKPAYIVSFGLVGYGCLCLLTLCALLRLRFVTEGSLGRSLTYCIYVVFFTFYVDRLITNYMNNTGLMMPGLFVMLMFASARTVWELGRKKKKTPQAEKKA
eukprot:Lithocolla_globosa_v1_NODE_6422_length_1090_cov_3.668599.p1 type:complete len:216 gc:universal NODE_6422_length_1090_cov_3.668599:739-92(-)